MWKFNSVNAVFGHPRCDKFEYKAANVESMLQNRILWLHLVFWNFLQLNLRWRCLFKFHIKCLSFSFLSRFSCKLKCETLFFIHCALALSLWCLPTANGSPGLGTPRSPPTTPFRLRGHAGVPQKVTQESSCCDAFTVLQCGVGRRSVKRGLPDHSAANGTSSPGPTVLVTATHKGAQEDANRDEWRFFCSAHSALIRAFHLLWPCASPSTGRLH